MENNHKLGLYVSYYLARFNEIAYQNLGFGNQKETHKRIGDLLSVKPQTVQNWRDEFDPLFGHRAGWYQRSMSISRIRVVQALEDLDELQIREIVLDILLGHIQNDNNVLEQLLNIASTDESKNKISKFILRAPTGRAAEEFFIKHFSENKRPIDGILSDCRDLGVGYDFSIEGEKENCYVEVKGLTDYSGGILFTSKEWMVAKSKGENYFLCIVSNISVKAEIIFIQDPATKLNPKKNIYTSIQINWSVPEKQLADLK